MDNSRFMSSLLHQTFQKEPDGIVRKLHGEVECRFYRIMLGFKSDLNLKSKSKI